MTFAMILNQKLLTTLAIASCVFASLLALLETKRTHRIADLLSFDQFFDRGRR